MPEADKHRPIAHVDELVGHFRAGCKPSSQVGVEHEKIAVYTDAARLGRAPDHATIARLLEAIARKSGWSRVEEHGQLIALAHPQSGSITLEPGGQVEHSGVPWPTAVESVRENDRHIDELSALAAEEGVAFLGVGFRPFGTLEDVPWMPKGRYRVMREYLPTRGTRAHEMMKRTATVQANFDYTDEADAMEMLRIGLGLSSLVTALFAASPLVDGKPVGYQSYRAWAWLDTDPDRCGLLPFAFREDASFRDYAEWALDVPMFFLYRDGEYRAMHLPFRRFLREGWQGERATAFDWEVHLSTLFPEVRLKRYVEVRQADASTREMARALPALWRGVFYQRSARDAAWSLVRDWSWDERLDLYQRTPREGLRARIRQSTVADLAAELVAIAKGGLVGLGSQEGAQLLEPLEQLLAEGRSVADRIVAEHARTDGNPQALIEYLRLR